MKGSKNTFPEINGIDKISPAYAVGQARLYSRAGTLPKKYHTPSEIFLMV